MSIALEEVARMIQRESGIVLGSSQLPALAASIRRVDRDLTAESVLEHALPSSATLQRLIDEVTIRETFFFRHRRELDAIDWYSVLETARARGSKVARIWVAGCASGEEAYTVAILASDAFASPSPPVRVLATDIAAPALRQAVAGRYGERAMRAVQAGVRERFFSNDHGASCVVERLRALVEVRRHNLVRDPIPPSGEQPFDVILCRNVLIYFDRPTVERVLAALEGALAPAGLLLLGAADQLFRHSLPAAKARRPNAAIERSASALASARASLLGSSRRDGPAAARKRQVSSIAASKGSSADRPLTPTDAMTAADRGELDNAMTIALGVLAENPLDSEAHFIRGVAELARNHTRAALEPLRRALYIDPNFALAAFKLACAHDDLEEVGAARRAYERTLRTLDHCGPGQAARSDQLDLLSVAAACHTRLQELSATAESKR